jgi:hypothetical protein
MRKAFRPSGEQPGALHRVGFLQRVVGNVPQAGQLGPRPDRPHDEADAVVGEAFRRLAGDFRGALVDLEGAVGKIEFRQGDRRPAEGVGLDAVRPRREILGVDVADDVGTGEHQGLGAVLAPQEVVFHGKVENLHQASHAAVAQQHPFGQGSQKITHRPTFVSVRANRRAAPPLAGRGRSDGKPQARGRTPSKWQMAKARSARFRV